MKTLIAACLILASSAFAQVIPARDSRPVEERALDALITANPQLFGESTNGQRVRLSSLLAKLAVESIGNNVRGSIATTTVTCQATDSANVSRCVLTIITKSAQDVDGSYVTEEGSETAYIISFSFSNGRVSGRATITIAG